MNRKYKRHTLRALKRRGLRLGYIKAMRESHGRYPIPKGHVLRQLFAHLHAGSINKA